MIYTQKDRLFAVLAESDAEQNSMQTALKALASPPVPITPPKPDISGSIICQAQADIPFAMQQDYWAQANGVNAHSKGNGKEQLTETGIHGARLPSGDTLRFGKVVAADGKPAFQFLLAPGDNVQNSSHRSEIEFPQNIEHEKTYWIAFKCYVFDWGSLPIGDDAFFGTQIHTGDQELRLGGPLGLVVYGKDGGRHFRVFACFSSTDKPRDAVTWKGAIPIEIPFGRWADFVIKIKQAAIGGSLQFWLDGEKKADYAGPLGLGTVGVKDYMKFGYYNWSAYKTPRKIQMRSIVVLADRGYGQEAVRALL